MTVIVRFPDQCLVSVTDVKGFDTEDGYVYLMHGEDDIAAAFNLQHIAGWWVANKPDDR